MQQLHKLEALGVALFSVIRDEEALRSALRPVYDLVENAVCHPQA